MSRLTDVVKNLIIINVIIFFGGIMLQDSVGGFIEMGKLFYFKSENFHPFQLITSMFMHANMQHIFMNMLGLFFLGPTVERALGPKKFLTLYLLAGLGGSLLNMGIDIFEYMRHGQIINVASLGASGCVYGVVLAFITMFPNEKLILFPIPIPIKAMYLGLAAVGYALFAGITDTEPGGIGHFAHLGGALIGFILVHYWKMANLR